MKNMHNMSLNDKPHILPKWYLHRHCVPKKQAPHLWQ